MSTERTRSYGGVSVMQRRAERRRRLLDAGLELFGTHGYAAISVSRVCRAAGLSTRQYYDEFASREELLRSLHDEINQEAYEAVHAALATLSADAPLCDQVVAALRAHLMSAASDPRRARVGFVEVIGVSPMLEAHRLGWRRRWADQITAIFDSAASRGEAARPRDLTAAAYLGAVNGLLQDWAGDENPAPLEDVVVELTRFALAVTG